MSFFSQFEADLTPEEMEKCRKALKEMIVDKSPPGSEFYLPAFIFFVSFNIIRVIYANLTTSYLGVLYFAYNR